VTFSPILCREFWYVAQIADKHTAGILATVVQFASLVLKQLPPTPCSFSITKWRVTTEISHAKRPRAG